MMTTIKTAAPLLLLLLLLQLLLLLLHLLLLLLPCLEHRWQSGKLADGEAGVDERVDEEVESAPSPRPSAACVPRASPAAAVAE